MLNDNQEWRELIEAVAALRYCPDREGPGLCDSANEFLLNPELINEETICILSQYAMVPDMEYADGYMFRRLAFVPQYTQDYIDIKKRNRLLRFCFGQHGEYAVFEVGVRAVPKYYSRAEEVEEKYSICQFERIPVPHYSEEDGWQD